jgi:RHS repeat-associated protein
MNVYEKRAVRFSSLLIASVLALNTVTVNVSNAAPGESQRKSQPTQVNSDIGELPNKLPKTKLELVSKRTKYSTRYVNPDGSFTEEIYSDPQFFQDTDKQWKKIDNNFQASKKNAGQHENTANDLNVSISDEVGSNPLVTIGDQNKSIGLIPVSGQNVKGDIQDNHVTYPNIFPGVDAEYTIKGSAVKEDLVLHNYVTNTFSYELRLDGVTAHVEKDGTIVFEDSHSAKKWFFDKPFMTDANGKYSDKVKLNLHEQDGKTYVDVVADQTFLQDPNTKYPVTIDPTIDSWDVQRDNSISTGYPNSYYSTNTVMEAGYDSYNGYTRALVNFALPSLPSGSVITSANFNAYQNKVDATTVPINLYRITSDWTPTVTWNTQPSVRSTAESSVTSNASNAYWQWDVTQLTKDWYTGYQPNFGLMLVQRNEANPYRSFNTVNSGSNTPRITINYKVEGIGLENYWSLSKDGVNPSNGNLVLQKNDLSIPGHGIPVSVTRTFNSRQSSFSGIFGYGWLTNIETRLYGAVPGPITLFDADGTQHIFGQKVGGGYQAAPGDYFTLVRNADSTWTITQTDGTKINLTSNGYPSSIVDTNGNSTTYNYDATTGQLTTIKDASNRATTITYGTNGKVSSIADPANHQTSYSYDASNNLIKVTDPAGKITTYDYDTDHNVTAVTNPLNVKTTYAYDTSDRVITISQPITINNTVQTSTSNYTYDAVNSVTSVTDGEGKRVDYTYNPNGNVVQVTENPLDAANKAITTFAYDNNNNLVQVQDPNTNKTGGTAKYVYTYDSNGNITSQQLPGSKSESYTYDTSNNLIKAQDFNSNVSSFDYDSRNNNTQSTDPNVQTAAQSYLANGNLDYSTNPMSAADNLITNSSFEKGVNWPDNWVQSTEAGKTASYAWSTASKFGPKSVQISNPTGLALVSSDQLVPYEVGKKYVLSAYVKTTGTTNSEIVKVQFLDSAGGSLGEQTAYSLKGNHDWTRVQAVIDSVPANTVNMKVSVGLNAGSGIATFDAIQLEKGSVLSAYNLIDNSSFERDANADKIPDGWTTSGNLSVNDGMDQNVNAGDDKVYSGKYSFKITGESTKSKYIAQHINFSGDAASKFTLSGWSKQSGANVSGGSYALQVAINYTDNTVDWSFANDFSKTAGEWQHVAAVVNPTKPFNSIDVYYYYYQQLGTAWFDSMRLEVGPSIYANTYEPGGNYVSNVDDPMGNDVAYTYDAVGNVTGITDGKKQTTSYAFDPRNLLTKVTDPKLGITSYGYDDAGNRTTVTDAINHVTTYGYNEFNKVSSMTNPLNQVIQLGYDKNGNPVSVTFPKGDKVTYTFNTLNRMDGIFYNGVKQWTIAYDANGNITSVTDSTGKATTYTYDSNNRLTQQAEGTSNKTDYGYDANGNPTSFTVTAGAATVSTGYGFNSMDQMVSLSRNSANQAKFVYDERGNVISVTRTNGTYTAYEYDAANRLLSLKNYNATGAVQDTYMYTYDANGNKTSVSTNNGTISYKYDSLNQLTQESLTDGTTSSYAYDAVGNRTTKTVVKGATTTTTNYTYDAANQLTAVGAQAYTYDANGNLTNNGSKTFVYDVENSLTQVKDSTGATLASYTYDQEGKRTSMTTSSGIVYFHYNGDKVIYETDASNNIVADYTWDQKGNPVTMTKGGVTYYYHLNGHGDVMLLTDGTGNIVAQYQYDAWGNITSQSGTMASSNPYRYAGYRYDEVTGLYYLMARYYDANIGRFITRDTFHGFEDDPLSLNQYAYTNNNPVMHVDPSGHYWDNHWWNSKWFVTNAINWAITLIIGTSIGGLSLYLRNLSAKYFAERAAVIFSDSLKNKLLAYGISSRIASYLATAANVLFNILMWATDPGTKLFTYWDSRDNKPNNGYLNI